MSELSWPPGDKHSSFLEHGLRRIQLLVLIRERKTKSSETRLASSLENGSREWMKERRVELSPGLDPWLQMSPPQGGSQEPGTVSSTLGSRQPLTKPGTAHEQGLRQV